VTFPFVGPFAPRKKRIPGGVNSPVRAFRHVRLSHSSSNARKAQRFGTSMGNEYIVTSAVGARRFWACSQRNYHVVCEAAARRPEFWKFQIRLSRDAELLCKWMPAIEEVRMVTAGPSDHVVPSAGARFTGRDKIISSMCCYHDTSMRCL